MTDFKILGALVTNFLVNQSQIQYNIDQLINML